MARVPITWGPRDTPLPATAALGLGPVARALGLRLRDRPALAAAAKVVAGPGLLCMLAPTQALPWVDGVIYLGREQQPLYMPTTVAPQLGVELLIRAIAARGEALPLAVVPDHALIIPLALARPIDASVLDVWIRDSEASS